MSAIVCTVNNFFSSRQIRLDILLFDIVTVCALVQGALRFLLFFAIIKQIDNYTVCDFYKLYANIDIFY